MHRYPLTAASAALAAVFQLLSSDALAHIELQSPMNRYSNIKDGDNKSCPCGAGTTNRDCDKPEEFSDPDRSADRATTFAPGDTITVRFDEYVGHGGRYRIAFDPDGADLESFNQNILLDEPDPSGKVGNMGQGSMWEFQVTLPNMTCDNCSLQLIQVMDGNTVDRVLNPVDRGGTYFQCADIVLANGTPPGGLPPAAPTDHRGLDVRPTPTAVMTTSPEMAAADMMPTRPATGSGNMMAALGSATDNSVKPTVMDAESDEGGGCSLGAVSLGAVSLGAVSLGVRSQRSWPGLALLSTVLVGAALRASRRPRR
jgi:hypothetical protein